MEVKNNLDKSKHVQEFLRLDIISKSDKIRMIRSQVKIHIYE